MKEYKYIIKVNRYNICSGEYEWEVYLTDVNPLFAMGEFIYTSLCKIDAISWSHWSAEREAYWEDQGVKIRTFHSKYWGKEL